MESNSVVERIRDICAAALMWVPVAAVVFSWLVWGGELPAVLPRQWTRAGDVAETESTILTLVIVVIVCTAAAVVGTVSALSRAPGSGGKVLFCSGFAAGLAAGIWASALLSVLSGPDGEPVRGSFFTIPMMSWAYGLLPLAVVTRRPEAEWVHDDEAEVTHGADNAAPMDDAGGQPSEGHGVRRWHTRVISPVLSGVALLVLGVAAVLSAPLVGGNWGAATVIPVVVMVAVAILCGVFAWISITIENERVLIRSMLLGLPLKRISRDEITGVDVVSVRPSAWGGWGLRFGPYGPGLILSGGTALRLEYGVGRYFTVTTPEANGAVERLGSV